MFYHITIYLKLAVLGIVRPSQTTQINGNELSQRESNVGDHRHHYTVPMVIMLIMCNLNLFVNIYLLALLFSKQSCGLIALILVIDGSPNFKLKYLLLLHSNFHKSIVLICSITY